MPTPYLKKLSEEGHGSIESLEKKWDEAKEAAAKEGKAEDYAYITGILKKMVGASVTRTRLNASTRLRAFDQTEKEESAIRKLHAIFPNGDSAKWPSKEDAIELINAEGFVDQHTKKPLTEASWCDLNEVRDPEGDYLHFEIPEAVSTYKDQLCLDFKDFRLHIS